MVRTTDYGKFLRYETPKGIEELRSLAAGKKFMNCGSSAFNDGAKEFILELLNQGSEMPVPMNTKPRSSLSIYEKCKHRGENTGETGQCGTCPSITKEQPIFYCGVHRVATTRPLKANNSVYGRPMNCIQCWAEEEGYETHDVPITKPIQIQSTSTGDQ